MMVRRVGISSALLVPTVNANALSGGFVVGVREAGTVQIPKILTDSSG